MRKTVLTVAAAMVVSATIAAVATWLIVGEDGGSIVSDVSEPQEQTTLESTLLSWGLAGPWKGEAICRTSTGELATEETVRNGQVAFCGWTKSVQVTVPQIVKSQGEWVAVSLVNGVEQRVRVNP